MQVVSNALIWDMDGVLVDSGAFHFRAWCETLKAQLNREISYAAFQRTFGLRNIEMLRDNLGFDMPDEEIEHLSQIKEARYRELLHHEGIGLLPGVQVWLEQAKTLGLRQAVASSAPRENVEAVVDVVKIRNYFDAMISAENVSRGKPDPEVYLAAANKLGIPASNCVVIEDAPVGIIGARRAAMKCIGVLTTHDHLDADVVINRLSELPLIETLRLLKEKTVSKQ